MNLRTGLADSFDSMVHHRLQCKFFAAYFVLFEAYFCKVWVNKPIAETILRLTEFIVKKNVEPISIVDYVSLDLLTANCFIQM